MSETEDSASEYEGPQNRKAKFGCGKGIGQLGLRSLDPADNNYTKNLSYRTHGLEEPKRCKSGWPPQEIHGTTQTIYAVTFTGSDPILILEYLLMLKERKKVILYSKAMHVLCYRTC